jgi:hypothetical protein
MSVGEHEDDNQLRTKVPINHEEIMNVYVLRNTSIYTNILRRTRITTYILVRVFL